MSRLRGLHVPFVQGHDDRVDAKILPDGVLADVRNGRLRKAGALALRRGWRPLDMDVVGDTGITIASATTVRDLYSTGESLVALVEYAGALQLQTLVEHAASRPWVRRINVNIPPVTRVRTVGNVPDLPAAVTRASAAVTSDGVWGATLQQTSAKSVLRVYRLATDETLFYSDFTNADDAAERRVVSMGDSFGILRYSGTELQLQEFDPAAASSGLGSNTTLVTAAITHWDVAVAPETTPTALHVVYVVAGEVSYAQYSFAGAQVGSTKQVAASGAQAAYVATDDVTAHVVYQDTADDALHLLSFAATGAYTTSAGPTALNGTASYGLAQIAIGYRPTNLDTVFVAAANQSGSATDVLRVVAASHSVTITTHQSTQLGGGWVVRGAYAGFGAVRGLTNGSFDAGYTDNDGPWYTALYNLSRAPGRPFAPGQAPTGDVVSALPRASDVTASQSRATGQVATTQALVQTWRCLDTARRPGVVFEGALYITGGVLTQFIAGDIAENGIHRPIIASATASNGAGTLDPGPYQYRAVVVWKDSGGRVHRSIVSDVRTVTVGVGEDTVEAVVHVPKTLRRDVNLVSNPVVELYRTETGTLEPGELFYHVATAVASASTDVVTINDTLPDSSIIDNKRLYTEGEFGVVSGVFDFAPPDPSAFASTGRTRMILAGAGNDYEFSQIAMPEEPAIFAQPGVSGGPAIAHHWRVDGRITGLATLDDTVVIGTANRIFVAGGEGPNMSGVGEFQPPARLPTDVGFYEANSIVEDADGLWFLGDADKLYVLPRGQGAPSFAGESVQDRFAAAVVGAGRDAEDGVTAWAVADGTMVLRHSPAGQWLGDALPFTPLALVAHEGRFYAVDSAGAVWEQSGSAFGDGSAGATGVALRVTTGDVQVYGLSGWGRLACVELLGEFQAAAAVLAEVSYDLGLTWTSLGTHTVTGLAAGTAFQRQWHPARQRGGKFRLRFTMTPSVTTTEGCRLTGFSVYFDQRSGQTRLDSAKRR